MSNTESERIVEVVRAWHGRDGKRYRHVVKLVGDEYRNVIQRGNGWKYEDYDRATGEKPNE